MKKNILKRGLSLILAVILIVSSFAACSSAPDTIHPVMTFEGNNYYYGMEIDKEKLLEKYPNTQISGSSYSITSTVSLIIRENDGKNIVAGFFITGASTAKINGIMVGDSQKKYLTNFENSSVMTTDPTRGSILGFYVYEGKYISNTKYNQYLTASRFEGTEAHETFLNTVCVSTAISNGTIITSLCYGDYHAIYDGK